jgi:hypothetical protein
MLHIRCGDDILFKLAALPGETLSWFDPLSEGPVPAGLPPAEFRALRAAWLARRTGQGEAGVLARMEHQDAGLERAAGHDEVVLWFEHDLNAQMMLVHLLTRLRAIAEAGTRVSLVCIDHHQMVARFVSLDQLDAGQLGRLFPRRLPVRLAQFNYAERIWNAFTDSDPSGLQDILNSVPFGDESAPLPFAAAVLRRHGKEFPSTRDGLSLTERLTLQTLEDGADTPEEAYRSVRQKEPAPWQSGLLFDAVLDDLAAPPVPLIIRETVGLLGKVALSVTEAGRAVLAGRADACRLRPFDRWRGGIHLTGPEPQWRWDAALQRFTRGSL